MHLDDTGHPRQPAVAAELEVVFQLANVVRSLRERIPIPARRDESAANRDITDGL